MSKDGKSNFLSKIEIFRDFTESELVKVIAISETRNYKVGDFLFNENVQRKNLFLVIEGEIELFKRSPFGEEKRLAILTK